MPQMILTENSPLLATKPYLLFHLCSSDSTKELPVEFWNILYSKCKNLGYTIYFTGKEEIIHAYFEDTVASDQEGIRKALAGPADFKGKIRSVVHSTHKYPLPVTLLNEAKLFYPEEWEKVEELKKFKLESVKVLLAEGEEAGVFKPGINFSVLCRMLQEVSEMFTDYDFLLGNKLTTTEAIDAALAVIFDGLLK